MDTVRKDKTHLRKILLSIIVQNYWFFGKAIGFIFVEKSELNETQLATGFSQDW